MPVSNSEILLKVEVKARLRYRSDSSFYEFLKNEENGFPMPFKVGGTAIAGIVMRLRRGSAGRAKSAESVVSEIQSDRQGL